MAKKVIRLTEHQLNNIVKESVLKIIQAQFNTNSHILAEGVQYDKENNTFIFNFEHDNETDIIKLEHIGKELEAFNKCFYYGYEFTSDVDSKVRTKFIDSIKFPESFDSNKDLSLFIQKAVNYLDSQICLPSYNVVVYPQSMSEINRKMLSYLSRLTDTMYLSIEMVKEVAAKIEFDYERFDVEVLQSIAPNGQHRYTQRGKEYVITQIKEMMDRIHQNDYFSIARDIKKNKYRPFIKNYYKFPNDETRKIYEKLNETNVLIIDDIVTSGTTISHVLKALRSVNDNNNIVIFSLIGKNIQ